MSVKQLVTLILISGLLYPLISCSPVYETTYHYKPPRSQKGRECVNDCLDKKQQCQQQCQRQYQTCRETARLAAMGEYYAYVQSRKKNDQPITRQIEDFADYSHCQRDCGCQNDYHQCFNNCGGTITEDKKCVAFCGNEPQLIF